jgi:glutaredoxin 3
MKIAGALQNKVFILLVVVLMGFIMFKLLTVNRNRNLAEQVLNRQNIQVIIYVREGCVYCKMAKDLLLENKITYEAIDLDSNPELQKKLIEKTQQTTVPYVFINNKFIGGYNDLLKLKQENKF